MFKDLISTRELKPSDVTYAIKVAEKMEAIRDSGKQHDLLKDAIMASLFFEPSTRTRLSFESAMNRLGGRIVTSTGKGASSFSKGETVYDAIKVIENYCDIIVIRDSGEDTPLAALHATEKPVINAGNGPDEHPTQALLDFFTIYKEFGRLENLNFVYAGDLKYSRVIHSNLYLASLFPNNHISFVSPKGLELPHKFYEELDHRGANYSITDSWDSVLPNADVVMIARVQQERFKSEEEYLKYKGSYVMNKKLLESKCKPEVRIMAPLPRVDEISTDIDDLPNAVYFKQVNNGVAMRMALLAIMLGKDEDV